MNMKRPDQKRGLRQRIARAELSLAEKGVIGIFAVSAAFGVKPATNFGVHGIRAGMDLVLGKHQTIPVPASSQRHREYVIPQSIEEAQEMKLPDTPLEIAQRAFPDADNDRVEDIADMIKRQGLAVSGEEPVLAPGQSVRLPEGAAIGVEMEPGQ